MDYKGNEFKALVFEFMESGSLEKWLHKENKDDSQSTSLTLLQRLNIVVDAASALHYLHHQCEQSIIHCDLKPSNVLLDKDMIAHVSDFGIARLLSSTKASTGKKSSTIGLMGTIGYTAPGNNLYNKLAIKIKYELQKKNIRDIYFFHYIFFCLFRTRKHIYI